MSGKCSHGGASDFTSTVVPRGSISKDERRPHNQALHDAAVNVAISASLQLLDNIRLAAGDHDFLRYNNKFSKKNVAMFLSYCGDDFGIYAAFMGLTSTCRDQRLLPMRKGGLLKVGVRLRTKV